MKTRIILDSGTEILVNHSVEELFALPLTDKGFAKVSVGDIGGFNYIKLENIIFIEES